MLFLRKKSELDVLVSRLKPRRMLVLNFDDGVVLRSYESIDSERVSRLVVDLMLLMLSKPVDYEVVFEKSLVGASQLSSKDLAMAYGYIRDIERLFDPERLTMELVSAYYNLINYELIVDGQNDLYEQYRKKDIDVDTFGNIWVMVQRTIGCTYRENIYSIYSFDLSFVIQLFDGKPSRDLWRLAIEAHYATYKVSQRSDEDKSLCLGIFNPRMNILYYYDTQLLQKTT